MYLIDWEEGACFDSNVDNIVLSCIVAFCSSAHTEFQVFQVKANYVALYKRRYPFNRLLRDFLGFAMTARLQTCA